MKYSLIVLMLALLACEDKPINMEWGTDFFPLRTGREWTYNISKTTYSYLGTPIEESYELNIAVTDSTIANGIVTYLLVASNRSANNEWQPVQSWSVRISGNEVIQNESNIMRVKMIFPVGSSTKWDGNQYNNEPPFLKDYITTAEQRLFRIENFNQPKELSSGLNFASTVTVVISNLFDPIIGQDVQKETYARQVGLVFKEVTQLVFCNQGACAGQRQGVSYTQTLTSYVP
ncbi:MAG: hypothetical protein KF763_00795 [Cyclobacteriaceae bacterium]|nr:hypothetical protein [Cyclobacteriaceae bacterium]